MTSRLLLRCTIVAAAAAAASIPSGCVSAGPSRPAARRPPADARPERLVPVQGQFEDTDGNRYGDSSLVVVYVYSRPHYDLPVPAKGSFEFTLADPGGTVIRRWEFDAASSERGRVTTPVGPGFAFTLSLLDDGGTDVVAGTEAELTCEFRASDGPERIRARVSAPVVVGPVRPGGATGWSVQPGR